MKIVKKTSFGLLAILAVLLAVATVVEEVQGTAFAKVFIYNSPIFIILWAILTAFSLLHLLQQKRYRQPFTFLIHLAFVVILLGAFTTWAIGKTGSLHLRENEVITKYIDNQGNKLSFPFSVTLTDFTINYYTGTQTPEDFVSKIKLSHRGNEPLFTRVSMNKIVSYKGYRFYQTSYDDDQKGTRLSVSYDPYGVAITYFGYGLLLVSLLLFFFGKQSEFRKLLKNPLLKNSVLGVIFTFGIFNLHAENKKSIPKVLPQKQAEQFCDLYTLYNGRLCPLQTLARDFTVKLYGKSTYKGYSAEQVFTGWMFYYPDWAKEKIIKIKGKKTQKLLGISGQYATVEDFFDEKRQNKLFKSLIQIYKGKECEGKKGIRDADEKFNIIVMLYSGEIAKIFPHRSSNATVNWYATNSKMPQDIKGKKLLFVRKSMEYLREIARQKDYEQFSKFTQKIKIFQEKAAGIEALPSKNRFRAEKLYNQINYTKQLFILFLVIGMASFAYFIRKLVFNERLEKNIVLFLNVVLLSGLLYLTFFIALRGYVSQHFPVTNGYETMQFLAWASLCVTLFLQFKFRIVLPFGLLLAGLTLLVSFLGQSTPKITPLMPVLSSPLLSIHVATIMISYLLFAFIMFNGIAGIILHFFAKQSSVQMKKLQIISQIILYPALFLLVIGTFIGAVWANVSWGRYWGWDPKEVWALITILVYSFPLHSVSMKDFQKPLFFHIFSVVAFFSVLFTYFGVNFLLNGLHSYANG